MAVIPSLNRIISIVCRPCPQCKTPVLRDSACPHMCAAMPVISKSIRTKIDNVRGSGYAESAADHSKSIRGESSNATSPLRAIVFKGERVYCEIYFTLTESVKLSSTNLPLGPSSVLRFVCNQSHAIVTCIMRVHYINADNLHFIARHISFGIDRNFLYCLHDI
jgi:hypothetical protein